MELIGSVQNYAWGKRGTESAVARLLGCHRKDCVKDTPYAEFWMGTHPSGPARVKVTGEALSQLIHEHPEYLGAASLQNFGPDLPFLFKVLSIQKALSIQAHPTKAFAEELHAKFPDVYKDPNHKPELAIALTPFKALCGFRPLAEVQQFLKDIPELKVVVGEDAAENIGKCTTCKGPEYLKHCFKALMTCEIGLINAQLSALLSRFKQLDKDGRENQMSELIEELAAEFPGDVGCFAPYFLNVIFLEPGQAIYLGPNEPHAYLSGDCIECMACSDNVVRAGLTPKFKDVETLCSMLNYRGVPAEEHLLKPVRLSDEVLMFRPPVMDFAVAKISISRETYAIPKIPTASIVLCTEGSARTADGVQLLVGCILFVPADHAVDILDNEGSLQLFRAMVNL